jgi:hypothetical protein
MGRHHGISWRTFGLLARISFARKTIDLEGRLVTDGVKKALRDRQLALAELVHAIRQYLKLPDQKPLTLEASDYAHAVLELNKALDRAEGFLQ